MTSWEAIAAGRLDLVVVSLCGFHLAGAIGQARPVAQALSAVSVWVIDADGLVVRPGSRLIDGVAALVSIFQPGAVPAAVQRVAAESG